MKKFYAIWAIFILISSCSNSELNEVDQNKNLENKDSSVINLLNLKIDVFDLKTQTYNLRLNESNQRNQTYVDEKNYSDVEDSTLNQIADACGLDFNSNRNYQLIKIDLISTNKEVNSKNDILGLNLYFLDDNKIINNRYYSKSTGGELLNVPELNGQSKELLSSVSNMIFNYSSRDYTGNVYFYSFLINKGFEINHQLTQNSLISLIYRNLTIDDIFNREGNIVSRGNPTCGGKCEYGQDFEDCVETPDKPVITDVRDANNRSTPYCDDNDCICCQRQLAERVDSENDGRVVDVQNAYGFRDGFLTTNNFTRSYVDKYYIVSDIYCQENLYQWNILNTYYNIYTIMDSVSKRLQDNSFDGVVLTTSESMELEQFIDSEIARNTNYSMLVSIFNEIKTDINYFKNKNRQTVIADILSRN